MASRFALSEGACSLRFNPLCRLLSDISANEVAGPCSTIFLELKTVSLQKKPIYISKKIVHYSTSTACSRKVPRYRSIRPQDHKSARMGLCRHVLMADPRDHPPSIDQCVWANDADWVSRVEL